MKKDEFINVNLNQDSLKSVFLKHNIMAYYYEKSPLYNPNSYFIFFV